MDALAQTIAENWKVIADAPVAFFVVAVCMGALIWAAVSWAYAQRLETRNSIIEMQRHRLDEYQAKPTGPHQSRPLVRLRA